MADLEYDTDEMRSSAQKYREIAVDLGTVEKDLKKQIADLKSVYWQSDAGDAFMDMYEETWAANVDKYILVLDKMASLLDQAANDYDSVTEKLKTIPEVG